MKWEYLENTSRERSPWSRWKKNIILYDEIGRNQQKTHEFEDNSGIKMNGIRLWRDLRLKN